MSNDLTDFYEYVEKHGELRTLEHAQRWTRATLNQFGLDIPRGAKKALAKALPDELSEHLTGVFWLAHFANPELLQIEFQEAVARRGGNTDKNFARLPITAVFSAIRVFNLLDSDTDRQVAEAISPDMRSLWEETRTPAVAKL